MDFHSLPRRDLQTLCKRNRIPANMTNVAMADSLQALPTVEGIQEIQESIKFQSPKKTKDRSTDQPITGRRTSARRRVIREEAQEILASAPARARRSGVKALEINKMVVDDGDEESEKQEGNDEMLETPLDKGSPLPRSRRVIARASEIKKIVIEGEEEEKGKQDKKEEIEKMLKTPASSIGRRTRAAAAPSTRRRGAKKEEKEGQEGLVEMPNTPATRRKASVARKMAESLVEEEEKGENVVGVRTRRTTRQTSRKHPEEVMSSGLVTTRRSGRTRAAVKMMALAPDEQQEKEAKDSLVGKKDGTSYDHGYGDTLAEIEESCTSFESVAANKDCKELEIQSADAPQQIAGVVEDDQIQELLEESAVNAEESNGRFNPVVDNEDGEQVEDPSIDGADLSQFNVGAGEQVEDPSMDSADLSLLNVVVAGGQVEYPSMHSADLSPLNIVLAGEQVEEPSMDNADLSQLNVDARECQEEPKEKNPKVDDEGPDDDQHNVGASEEEDSGMDNADLSQLNVEAGEQFEDPSMDSADLSQLNVEARECQEEPEGKNPKVDDEGQDDDQHNVEAREEDSSMDSADPSQLNVEAGEQFEDPSMDSADLSQLNVEAKECQEEPEGKNPKSDDEGQDDDQLPPHLGGRLNSIELILEEDNLMLESGERNAIEEYPEVCESEDSPIKGLIVTSEQVLAGGTDAYPTDSLAEITLKGSEEPPKDGKEVEANDGALNPDEEEERVDAENHPFNIEILADAKGFDNRTPDTKDSSNPESTCKISSAHTVNQLDVDIPVSGGLVLGRPEALSSDKQLLSSSIVEETKISCNDLKIGPDPETGNNSGLQAIRDIPSTAVESLAESLAALDVNEPGEGSEESKSGAREDEENKVRNDVSEFIKEEGGGDQEAKVKAEKLDLEVLSLRKLKSLYKEKLASKKHDKVEGKRAALTALDENCL